MKMLRILLLLSAILLAAVVASVFFLGTRINGIVERAIESGGTDISGTPVTVASVDFSFREGRGTILGISLSNPPGFPAGNAFTLDEVTVRLDLGSLKEDPIVVEEAVIRAPVVKVIAAESGKTNIGAIARHVREALPRTEESGEKKEGEPPRLAVRSFIFEEGRIDIDATAVGGGTESVDLPPLRLRDLGGPGGAEPAALGGEILLAYSDAVLKAAARAGIGTWIEREIEGALGTGSGPGAAEVIRSILGGSKR